MKPALSAWLRNHTAAFLIVSSSLVLFYVLYQLRYLDDSRLTSWNDVFSLVQPLRTWLLLSISLFVAFILSRYSLIERNPLIYLFIVSFAASALFWKEPEMIVDASRYLTQAKHLERYGFAYFFREWGSEINAWTDLPAIPFMYGALFTFFGESRLVIQIFNTLLYSLTLIITYLTGKELWDRNTGLYAAILLLGIPYLFTQLPLMLVDIPSMFFLMLSIYSFLLALRRGSIMVLIAGLTIFITFFTKYSAWLMLTVIPVLYAVELYQNRKEGLDRYALRGMIVLFISSFLISVVIAFNHDTIVRQIQLLISYQMPGLRRWGESFVSMYFFQMHPIIAVLAVGSVFIAVRERDVTLLGAAWLVFVALALQVGRIRYILMVFPLLCLMASYGLRLIRDQRNARFMVHAAAAFSLTLALSGFLPFLQTTSAANLKDAAEYIDSLDVESVEVFTPLPEEYVMNPAVSVPLLDLYTRKKIVYRYEEAEYPLPEDADISSLRFTWTYRNPQYYQEEEYENDGKAVVIITDNSIRDLPPLIHQKIVRFSSKKTFAVSDNVFRHKTLVTVFH